MPRHFLFLPRGSCNSAPRHNLCVTTSIEILIRSEFSRSFTSHLVPLYPSFFLIFYFSLVSSTFSKRSPGSRLACEYSKWNRLTLTLEPRRGNVILGRESGLNVREIYARFLYENSIGIPEAGTGAGLRARGIPISPKASYANFSYGNVPTKILIQGSTEWIAVTMTLTFRCFDGIAQRDTTSSRGSRGDGNRTIKGGMVRWTPLFRVALTQKR